MNDDRNSDKHDDERDNNSGDTNDDNAKSLSGAVAVVTGASRGVGRGVAHELGLAGATVYVTGRSRAGARTEDLPGSIDETAALVTESGGRGIAVACDHTDDAAVAALADTIRARHPRIDILVNAVWGGYENYDVKLFEMPPWEQPVWRWDKMFATGVRAAYVTTRALLPLMVGAQTKRTIINISAGDRGRFLGDVQYDVAKAACDRLGFAMARRLRGDNIHVVTVHPGFTRTERVEREAPPEALKDTHSARFVGRIAVALHRDPRSADIVGQALRAGELGQRYDLVDVDGSRPAPFEVPEM